MKKFLKKYLFDILLGLLVIIISVSILIGLGFKKNDDNLYAVIYYHNEVYDRIDLTNTFSEQEREYDFDGKKVVVVYSHNKVKVRSADCHDHTCVKMGETSKENKPIVCLDIGFVVRIEGESSLDVVVG